MASRPALRYGRPNQIFLDSAIPSEYLYLTKNDLFRFAGRALHCIATRRESGKRGRNARTKHTPLSARQRRNVEYGGRN